jgi:hypothetical protein
MSFVRPCATSGEREIYRFIRMLSVTQIFQAPNTITMTIAATRMYRSLMNLSTDT